MCPLVVCSGVRAIDAQLRRPAKHVAGLQRGPLVAGMLRRPLLAGMLHRPLLAGMLRCPLLARSGLVLACTGAVLRPFLLTSLVSFPLLGCEPVLSHCLLGAGPSLGLVCAGVAWLWGSSLLAFYFADL